MEVANTFIPTAGVVGLLPMVTYFFLVVTMFAFLASSIFSLATQSGTHSEYRTALTLTGVMTAIAGLSYYFIQSYYQDMLAELVTVTDVNDQQTLIRESYNAIGQYRYMAWFVTAPLFIVQLVFSLNRRLSEIKRPVAALLAAVLFMFFASYIGHQQLSFDNEVQVGMKAIWGLMATVDYVFILFTLYRLWQQYGEQTQRTFRLMALITVTGWGIYLIGYFLTLTDIDFNWIHLVFTTTDVVNYAGGGLMTYFASLNALER